MQVVLVRLLDFIGAAVAEIADTVPLLYRLFTGVCIIFGPCTVLEPNPLLLRLNSYRFRDANKFVALLTCDSSLLKAEAVWAGSLGPILNFDFCGDFALTLITVGVFVAGELLPGLLNDIGCLFGDCCFYLYWMFDW